MCNSDTRCPVRVVAGVLLLIVARGVNACDPSLHVDLLYGDPRWNHLGCSLSVDATATGGIVNNYNYYYFSPFTVISWCSSPPSPSCGGPPPTSVLFPSVGQYTVCVSVSQNNPYDWAMDDQHVFVVATDISADSTYVAVNDDDDDGDGNMDLAQVTPGSSTITGEDDLVQIHLSFTSPGGYRELGKVRLNVGGAYPHVKIWSSSTRGTCLINGGGSYEWNAGSQPSSVWIEGLNATSACEVWIQYVDPYGTPHPSGCTPPTVQFTVVHADMDLAGVDDDPTGGGATTTEETIPGGFVPVGGFRQLTVKPVLPTNLSRQVTLSATGAASKIQVWNSAKTQQISLPHTFSPTSNTTFWVKGYQASSALRDVALTLTHTATGFADDINMTVYAVDVNTVGFTSDHMITKWPGTTKIDDPDGSTPVWSRAGMNEPVCYTKNTVPTMFANLTVTPEIPEPGISNVWVRCRIGATVIGSTSGCLIVGDAMEDGGANRDGIVSGIGGGAAVPGSNGVKTLSQTLTWEISLDGVTWLPAGASGAHTMYWTDSTPAALASSLHDLGLAKACAYVNGDADIGGKICSGFADEIYYDPNGCTSHDLGIFAEGSGQCCCHAAVFSLLVSHVTSSTPSLVYLWGGCSSSTLCSYRYGTWHGPSFQCDSPECDGALYHPHFMFHVEANYAGTVYDPSYGTTGLTNFILTAPAHSPYPAAVRQAGPSLPGTQHLVMWP